MSRCQAALTPMLSRSALAAGLLFVTASCGKGDDDSSTDGSATGGMTAEECGDIDGNGGDSGDVPNILGAWNASFASIVYGDGGCSVPGLGADDMRAMLDGVMYIDGRVPDRLFATFNQDEERYFGLENAQGGVVFTGTKTFTGHVLYISLGGLLYTQGQLDRDEIRGYGYIGVDLDGADTSIDCWLQGDFIALRSGA